MSIGRVLIWLGIAINSIVLLLLLGLINILTPEALNFNFNIILLILLILTYSVILKHYDIKIATLVLGIFIVIAVSSKSPGILNDALGIGFITELIGVILYKR
jgi:hypothetical protein